MSRLSTFFPNDGIRIENNPRIHDPACEHDYGWRFSKERMNEVHDVLSPDVARTMTAMLEGSHSFGNG